MSESRPWRSVPRNGGRVAATRHTQTSGVVRATVTTIDYPCASVHYAAR